VLSQFAGVGQFDGLFNPAPGFAGRLRYKCFKSPGLRAIIARNVKFLSLIPANSGVSIGHFQSFRLDGRLIYRQPVAN
jgi:hypothetical protein